MTMDVREIVARLKGHSEIMERDKGKFVRFIDVATCTEAVDVIEAQAAEIERLRGVIRQAIVDGDVKASPLPPKAALGETE
jgi:hypothetical protein